MGKCPKKGYLPDRRQAHERLTEQQFHVACGIVAGKSDSEIGRQMEIHRATVKRYVLRIELATGLNRDAVAAYAKKHAVFGYKEKD